MKGASRGVEDLEAELRELRETLSVVTGRSIPLVTATLRHAIDAEIDSIEDLPDEGRTFSDRLAGVESRLDRLEARLDRLGEVGAERSTKDQKVAAVLTYAVNKQRGGQPRVAVTASEVKGCVGVSRRYAYDLLEAIAESVDGCRLRESTAVQTGTGVERKKKALLVDCERLHTSEGSVNQFTTGGEGHR